MSWTVLDVAETRRLVEALLEALSLESYAFNVEATNGSWDVHVEYGSREGWQTRTLRVDDGLLQQSRNDSSVARRRLLDTWRDALLRITPDDDATSGAIEVNWNVVVTVYPGSYVEARRLLEHYGEVTRTPYFNVLVLTVPDVGALLERLEDDTREDMTLLNAASRIIPAQETFDFHSPKEFEDKVCQAVEQMVPRLKDRSFHVRMHRRGFKGHLSSQAEERFLDEYILARLEEAHSPGRVTFDDPDAIITVETVGPRAGLSCWSREQHERYPFLNLD
jgi:tRNA(Ser,Leu) C12 N-acetylase TAN1